MTNTCKSLENLLRPVVGRHTYASEDKDDAFHPEAVLFYNEEPRSAFVGMVQPPIFETNLLLGEMDDDRKYRLERDGEWLVYTRYERSTSDGTTWVTGQAIACPAGSDAESEFVRNAMADVMAAASEPLRCAMQAMRDAKLALSESDARQLSEDVFGSTPA